MKKILPILLFFVSLQIFSQDHRDKVQALRVSFITERLELTQEEAQQFWPVYNAYDEATRKIKFEELRHIRREIKDNLASLSDKKANELLDKITSAENRLHDEEAKLNTKLKKIISAKKILMLNIAEEDFKKKMFEQWKKMRRERK